MYDTIEPNYAAGGNGRDRPEGSTVSACPDCGKNHWEVSRPKLLTKHSPGIGFNSKIIVRGMAELTIHVCKNCGYAREVVTPTPWVG